MKRLFILTMVVALMTGAAMAAPWQIAPNATFAAGSPATTNNDDSCDISTQPAATLLLPVFEVDITSTDRSIARDTNFTIVNTSNLPQIAHITVWTDWSVPVLDFNVFLTGYDVQGISLYDVIGRGVLPGGGSQTEEGAFSALNSANPNHAAGAMAACDSLPTQIPQVILSDLRTALTTGNTAACTGSSRIGSNNHGTNAVGYVTIDVGNTCSQSLPTDPNYYTNEILFDNTLIGDYMRINPGTATGNYAGADVLVPIRAVPEGGAAGAAIGTNLPFTFYDRYTPVGNRRADRRQPLPSVFAARYIAGGAASFGTRLAIWREGVTRGLPTCGTNAAQNGTLAIAEIVRFDESENPTSLVFSPIPISPAPPGVNITAPEASLQVVGTSNIFPAPSGSSDVGGWMYMNLNNGNPAGSGGTRPSQNWIEVQMTAESRYGVDFAAASIGNGCSAARTVVGITNTPSLGTRWVSGSNQTGNINP